MKKAIFLLPLLLAGCVNDPKCKHDQVTVGLSEAELIELCGIPKQRNHTRWNTQWVYRGSEDLYVYTDDGKVSSVQWSE